jgi:hypothetical protein
MKLRNHADFAGYEARNAKQHVLGADPALGAGDAGRTWWNSVTGRFRGWDGLAAHTLTNLIESVAGTGALTAELSGKAVSLSIAAASPTVPGTMSAADKAKLDAATATLLANTLVQRDGNGSIVVTDITGHLVGTADNATLHGGATLASVRDFSLSTGQRTALSAISDFDAATRLNRLDQLTAPAAAVSMNSQRLVSLADPVNAQDGATKNYVDSVATGLDPKGSVRMATTAALPASTYANGAAGVGATLTATANGVMGAVGGLTPAVNDRILVKDQASAPQNGLYVVTSVGAAGAPWVLTRAADADSTAEVTGGLFTFVEGGTLAATGWVLNVTGAVTLGSTNLPFQQFSGAGTYAAGNGLSLTGTTFAAVGTANRVSVGAGGIDIAATYVGQASITTLGTVATGVWNATTIGVAKGGTGATTAVAARTNLGAVGKFAIDIPAGTTLTITHGLNTLDVIVLVREVATGDVVIVDPRIIDVNNISIGFGDPVAAGAYRVVVVG